MFFYLEFLILRLPDMLSIDSDTVSEFSFTNSSFIGAFFTTCGANDNIKKIITIARKIGLQIECFLKIFFQSIYLPVSLIKMVPSFIKISEILR